MIAYGDQDDWSIVLSFAKVADTGGNLRQVCRSYQIGEEVVDVGKSLFDAHLTGDFFFLHIECVGVSLNFERNQKWAEIGEEKTLQSEKGDKVKSCPSLGDCHHTK